MNTEWFSIDNVMEIDSPMLLVYPQRVIRNIRLAIQTVGNVNRLRPHVKTHKSANITRLLLHEGITRFKCATIAEAEMLGMEGAPDVLLAYQPVGPKAERLADLVYEYPGTTYSCLVDNPNSLRNLDAIFTRYKLQIPVYIDLNVGMNRTGIDPASAESLAVSFSNFHGVRFEGLHAYDGHLRDTDLVKRTDRVKEAFAPVITLKEKLISNGRYDVKIIAGGSPTFPIHALNPEVECSPGTFVYWDLGYNKAMPDLKFEFAALVLSRVVSKPSKNTICIDLGHKSIASENPLGNRVQFLNAPLLEPIGHSEEHMILTHPSNQAYEVGDVLYGLPYHICPTCALYDSMMVVQDGHVRDRWMVSARGRRIGI